MTASSPAGFSIACQERLPAISSRAPLAHWGLAKELFAHQLVGSIRNHCGPTETTVGVLTYPLTEKDTAHRAVTASFPRVACCQACRSGILDRYGNPAHAGVPGVLCVGGPFVARDYLNHPDQMASQLADDIPGGQLAGRYYNGGRARPRGQEPNSGPG